MSKTELKKLRREDLGHYLQDFADNLSEDLLIEVGLENWVWQYKLIKVIKSGLRNWMEEQGLVFAEHD